MNARAVKVLEGFAGPGGFSEAARMVGVTDALGFDLDADACATAEAAGHPRLQVSIRDLDPDDYPNVEGWVSAPPCPTFTRAGKQSGVKDYQHVLDGINTIGDWAAGFKVDYSTTYETVSDPRTALVLETLNFAFRLPNVQWVVAEQVPAVHGIWEETCFELAATYCFESCSVVTLRADDFGAATRRARVFIVAARDHTPDFTGMPTRGRWSCGRYEAPRLHLPNLYSPFPRTSMAQALGWPEGLRINTRGERKTAGGNEFSADGPAVSMTGNGTRTWYRTDLGSEEGRITSAQAGLMQGFPADYPWKGSRSSQFQRVADTVSPLVGAAVIGAAAGLPWHDAVSRRLEALYGPHSPVQADPEQLDLFQEAAA